MCIRDRKTTETSRVSLPAIGAPQSTKSRTTVSLDLSKQKEKPKRALPPEENFDALQMTPENFEMLKQRLKVTIKSQQTFEKKFQREKEELLAGKDAVVKENERLNKTLDLKTKECKTLTYKLNEMKRALGAEQMEEKRPDPVRVEETGRNDTDAIEFDDGEIFPDFAEKQDLRLTGMKVWVDEKRGVVAGLQAFYRDAENKLHGGRQNVLANKVNIEINLLQFDLPVGDYIVKLGGTLTDVQEVESLRFESKKGKVFGFGLKKGKEFNLSLGEGEIPVLVNGAIRLLKDETTKEEIGSKLIRIGAAIIQDDDNN
eukprot:TRINITY_DN9150_c0_g1_i1.p1 TRINITY_DN9150_c0_g1~~TRINITY_DN9150_c0_g1_i1.p1  ORF type:complete len:315 (+),score=110.55 TRINITY_DN9150_c0_g1_i1:65-1009(+)